MVATVQMQALGSPPAEIMGDLPPGFVRVDLYHTNFNNAHAPYYQALGADGMPSLGDGEACTIA